MAYKEIDESEIILIDSVSSFIENIKKVKEKKESKDGTSTELYFRGQETEFWDIEPSIFRDDIGTRQPELEQYIIDNFSEEFKEVVGIDDVKEVLNIIRMHFTADWYKRKRALSKIKMTITGYYFDKWQSKDNAKQKAEQIMTLLNQMVEDFIMSANERGD